MKHSIVCVLFLLILSACSNSDQEVAITKKSVKTDETVQEDPVLEDTSMDSEEEKMVLEFTLPNEQIIINLEHVPILSQFLRGVNDQKAVIRDMELIKLEVSKQPYYLLEFACYQERCSYLLLDQSGNGQSFLLTDLARYKQMAPSPDNTKMLFLFERKKTKNQTTLFTHQVQIFDIEEWKPVKVETEEYSLDYSLPILNASWENDEQIELSIADVSSLESPTLEYWYTSEKRTRKIKLTLSN
ncbi:hypothetical protein [Radiobacillus deserti]|uniref:Lipoprotein n=1 Tax=Radiobacillus deserti TaxID=2594883 RepID=A0A516KF43_9BACI|nr:hypothetical protein [Radiobacillus deserti]QDP40014.1 hypothetical protein FN924_07440 [Radiobacillus deserti]